MPPAGWFCHLLSVCQCCLFISVFGNTLASLCARSTAWLSIFGTLLQQPSAHACRFPSDNSPPAELHPVKLLQLPGSAHSPPPHPEAQPAPPPPPGTCLASPGLPSASPLTVGTLPQLLADILTCSPFALCPHALPCGRCVFPSSLSWTWPWDWLQSRASE